MRVRQQDGVGAQAAMGEAGFDPVLRGGAVMEAAIDDGGFEPGGPCESAHRKGGRKPGQQLLQIAVFTHRASRAWPGSAWL